MDQGPCFVRFILFIRFIMDSRKQTSLFRIIPKIQIWISLLPQTKQINRSMDLRRRTVYKHFHFVNFNILLRWPNTVLARVFADAIQHVHKDFNK